MKNIPSLVKLFGALALAVPMAACTTTQGPGNSTTYSLTGEETLLTGIAIGVVGMAIAGADGGRGAYNAGYNDGHYDGFYDGVYYERNRRGVYQQYRTRGRESFNDCRYRGTRNGYPVFDC